MDFLQDLKYASDFRCFIPERRSFVSVMVQCLKYFLAYVEVIVQTVLVVEI